MCAHLGAEDASQREVLLHIRGQHEFDDVFPQDAQELQTNNISVQGSNICEEFSMKNTFLSL